MNDLLSYNYTPWTESDTAERSVGRVIAFNQAYLERMLQYFAKLRLEFEQRFPGASYPGIFAEVETPTGEIRPRDKQLIWSWCDTRGLGIWSYLLLKDMIPEVPVAADPTRGSLKNFIDEYCTLIYNSLLERLKLNDGILPFIVDPATNEASNDPRNIKLSAEQAEPGLIFAGGGFIQYGILRNDSKAIEMGLKMLKECVRCGLAFDNVDYLTGRKLPVHTEGFLMVTLGAITDSLKADVAGGGKYSELLRRQLIPAGKKILTWIFNNHCEKVTGCFWENNNENDEPLLTPEGGLICDPGHTSEFCGFAAQFSGFLPATERNRILPLLLNILRFVDSNGFSPAGVMYKNINVHSGRGTCDTTVNGVSYKTAPWWNLCELGAATSTLWAMTGEDFTWEIFKRAANGLYSNYPQKQIDYLMVQTLDAESLQVLPFNPATANLDPMHAARALCRQIEAFGAPQELISTKS